MTDDIYSPPESDPQNETSNNASELASRPSRLGASLIDSLIAGVFVLPVMFLTGGFDQISNPEEQPSLLYNLAMGIVAIVVFAAINFKLLASNGQTIGKKAVGIKIVTMQDELPSLKENLLKRYAVYFIPGQVPIIGQIFSLVNVLFIFKADQRCIHDLVGDTKVVNA